MSELTTILTQATPLGVVALSLFIILQLIKQKRSLNDLKNNHLHDVSESLVRIEGILTRQSETLSEIKTGIEVVKAKLNGRDK
jgi:hypothetical protein